MKYLYASILILIIGLGLYAYIESERVDSLKDKNQVLTDRIEQSEAARKKEQQDTIDANNRRAIYEKDLNAKEQELVKLRINLSSGATVLRIAAKCPLSSTSTSTARDESTTAELTGPARQAYIDLVAGIKKTGSICGYFRQEGIAR